MKAAVFGGQGNDFHQILKQIACCPLATAYTQATTHNATTCSTLSLARLNSSWEVVSLLQSALYISLASCSEYDVYAGHSQGALAAAAFSSGSGFSSTWSLQRATKHFTASRAIGSTKTLQPFPCMINLSADVLRLCHDFAFALVNRRLTTLSGCPAAVAWPLLELACVHTFGHVTALSCEAPYHSCETALRENQVAQLDYFSINAAETPLPDAASLVLSCFSGSILHGSGVRPAFLQASVLPVTWFIREDNVTALKHVMECGPGMLGTLLQSNNDDTIVHDLHVDGDFLSTDGPEIVVEKAIKLLLRDPDAQLDKTRSIYANGLRSGDVPILTSILKTHCSTNVTSATVLASSSISTLVEAVEKLPHNVQKKPGGRVLLPGIIMKFLGSNMFTRMCMQLDWGLYCLGIAIYSYMHFISAPFESVTILANMVQSRQLRERVENFKTNPRGGSVEVLKYVIPRQRKKNVSVIALPAAQGRIGFRQWCQRIAQANYDQIDEVYGISWLYDSELVGMYDSLKNYDVNTDRFVHTKIRDICNSSDNVVILGGSILFEYLLQLPGIVEREMNILIVNPIIDETARSRWGKYVPNETSDKYIRGCQFNYHSGDPFITAQFEKHLKFIAFKQKKSLFRIIPGPYHAVPDTHVTRAPFYSGIVFQNVNYRFESKLLHDRS